SISYREATMFAEAIAKIVAQRTGAATTQRAVQHRKKGTVYVDALQNGRGKTLAGVYSLRAWPDAPVSTPVKWSELEKPIDPSEFNLKTVPKRIKTVGDLFEPVLRDKQDVRHLVRALRAGE